MSTKEKETPTKETEFKSFCGFDFDPAKKSDCATTCQKENPDEYKRCVENFKTKPVKEKKKASTGGRGKSKWGHINGTQAGLIDVCLAEATKLVTLDEIREYSGAATKARTLHHLKHLVNDLGVDVQLNKDGKIFWAGGYVRVAGVASITTLVLRKKKITKTKEKKEEKK